MRPAPIDADRIRGRVIETHASYWQEEGRSARPDVGTLPVADARIVVVGAGLAGLATAISVLEAAPGTDVLVLDAHEIGWGASGRNGGLLSPLAAPVWLLSAEHNPDHAWALSLLNRRAERLGRWIASELGETSVRPTPLVLDAQGRITSAGLAHVARAVERCGIESRLLRRPDRPTLTRLVLSASTVQPYRLVCALARRALALGARIVEHTPVAAIEAGGTDARVRLADGRTLAAHRVVLATNAYSGSIRHPGRIAARVMHNYMLATAPLEARQRAQLPDDGAAFGVELNLAYVFHRLHDGRLVYGGIDKTSQKEGGDLDVPVKVYRELERLLARSLAPQACPSVEWAWGGRYHATPLELPIVRPAEPRSPLILNVGYGGTGVVLTLAMAPVAAALALDRPVADPENQRLAEVMAATRIPVGGLVRLGGHVASGLVRNLLQRR